ncbi:MAG: hypothetical protein GX075_04030 [Firmicutes bacterium]|nr:hypothetical protein [Bacillota bacterium]
MPTDTSEKGLETIVVQSLVNDAGYRQGEPGDFDREYAVDLAKLTEFVNETQPKAYEALSLGEDCPRRTKFLGRLQGEIAKRGVIDVLRLGVNDGPVALDLFYGTPSVGNLKAQELFTKNIFSVTRQLRYSQNETQLALDLVVFINGLPEPVLIFKLSTQTFLGRILLG